VTITFTVDDWYVPSVENLFRNQDQASIDEMMNSALGDWLRWMSAFIDPYPDE
jgi:hypothetical protein